MQLEWNSLSWGMFGYTWRAFGREGLCYTVDEHHRRHDATLTVELRGEQIEKRTWPDHTIAKTMAQLFEDDKYYSTLLAIAEAENSHNQQ